MRKNYLRSSLLLSLLSVSAFATTHSEVRQSLIDNMNNKNKKVQVIVRVKEGVNTNEAYKSFLNSNSIEENSIEVVKSFPLVGASLGTKSIDKKHILVLKSTTLSENELLSKAKEIYGVEAVELDQIVKINTVPNDIRYPELWGMENNAISSDIDTDIDALEAWKIHRGSKNVVVGVIDTGVDYKHEDLVNNMWMNPNEIPNNNIDDDENGYIDDIYGIDTVNGDSDPMADDSHGTHVAGTIGAEGNNSVGVVGVNWTSSIAACKFLDAAGAGELSSAIECVNYFTDLKVNRGINIVVTNNSWGGAEFSQELQNAIALAGESGILFVAAAGNENKDNDDTLSYPASYNLNNIISVAATNINDERASFSNYGVNSVDLAAPGEDILSTVPNEVTSTCIPNNNEVLYSERFESGLEQWEFYTENIFNPNVDLPNEHFMLDANDFASDAYSLTETLAETYNNNRFQIATIKDDVIDLSNVSADETVCVSFEVKGEIESSWDQMALFVMDDNTGQLNILSQIDGYYEDWTEVSVNLPSKYFMNNLNIGFFRFNDTNTVYGGYNIDNLKISTGDIIVPSASNSYAVLSGTSMAAPYVTGAVALLASAQENLKMNQLKEIILNTVDVVPALNGIVATGGRLNIHKMLQFEKSLQTKVKNDFNGDGYSDILIKNVDNFGLSGWFGTESINLTSNFLKTLSVDREVVEQGDINGDGYLDLIISNTSTNVLAMLKNTKDGMFENVYLKGLSEGQKVIAVGDVNGDGYDDVLVQNMNNLRINALLGSANGTVSTQYIKTLSEAQEFHSVMDVNGDGYDDVVVKNNNNGRVNAWISYEDGHVQNKHLKTLSPEVEIVESIDYNNDGYDDIIVKNNNNGRVNVWLSDANANITNSYVKTLSSDLKIAGLSDINGDGFPEIIVANQVNNRVSAWINSPMQRVSTQYLKTLSPEARLIVDRNDVNGDGYEDIIMESATKRVSAWLGSPSGKVSNQYIKALSENQEILLP
ncbi:MAG: Serine protease, subtilase family [uncultured Sulfurovum sp.]|uniref:Serine protease, subtilase family n=1 Tax=uncultured Sulfurovum sp. TaxID=269237 RepID=A0A6S6TWV3_9BACT|nr:MAG: Serine protease, subtilase family [uncultured Sulfurovum sp.]